MCIRDRLYNLDTGNMSILGWVVMLAPLAFLFAAILAAFSERWPELVRVLILPKKPSGPIGISRELSLFHSSFPHFCTYWYPPLQV